MSQDETLKLVAEVVDKFSGPVQGYAGQAQGHALMVRYPLSHADFCKSQVRVRLGS
jgi:hypothetical protein